MWLVLPKGTLLFILNLLSTIQVLFCKSTFCLVSSQTVMFHGATLLQMQEFAFALEFHELVHSSSLPRSVWEAALPCSIPTTNEHRPELMLN